MKITGSTKNEILKATLKFTTNDVKDEYEKQIEIEKVFIKKLKPFVVSLPATTEKSENKTASSNSTESNSTDSNSTS